MQKLLLLDELVGRNDQMQGKGVFHDYNSYSSLCFCLEMIERCTAGIGGVEMKDTVPNGVGMGEIHSGHSPSINTSKSETGDPVISMEGLTASWSMDNDKPVLSNISFSVDKVQ